jgi:hypothetical protein
MPSAPFCGEYGTARGCDSWEIEQYRSELQRAIDEAIQYADEAQAFASEAADYAQCVADEARGKWNDFTER